MKEEERRRIGAGEPGGRFCDRGKTKENDQRDTRKEREEETRRTYEERGSEREG